MADRGEVKKIQDPPGPPWARYDPLSEKAYGEPFDVELPVAEKEIPAEGIRDADPAPGSAPDDGADPPAEPHVEEEALHDRPGPAEAREGAIAGPVVVKRVKKAPSDGEMVMGPGVVKRKRVVRKKAVR